MQLRWLGAKAGPRNPAAGIENKHAALLEIATGDSTLERTIELLAGGAHPTKLRNDAGRTALAEAVRMNATEIVHRMLEAGGDPADTVGIAATSTNAFSVALLRELVDAGAKARPTALAFAPEYYFQPTKIPLLVKAGADPSVKSTEKLRSSARSSSAFHAVRGRSKRSRDRAAGSRGSHR